MNRIPAHAQSSSTLVTEIQAAQIAPPASHHAQAILQSAMQMAGELQAPLLNWKVRAQSAAEPIAIYATDALAHEKMRCHTNTCLIHLGQQMALQLHREMAGETPAPQLPVMEKVGIAFFAQVRNEDGAIQRLNDTLLQLAETLVTTCEEATEGTAQLQFLHAHLPAIADVEQPNIMLPAALVRIRYTELDEECFQELMGHALASLPALEQDEERDVFTLTLSGAAQDE